MEKGIHMQLRDELLNLLLFGASIGLYTDSGWVKSDGSSSKPEGKVALDNENHATLMEYGVHTLEWKTNRSWRNKDGTLSSLPPKTDTMRIPVYLSTYTVHTTILLLSSYFRQPNNSSTA